MRLKNVVGAKDLIDSNPLYIIDNQENEFVDLAEYNKRNLPIHIEIGMGKGKFIYTLAKLNPDLYYIGIEKFDSVIVRALEKQISDPVDNLLLIRTDASDLRTLFKSNSISRVYLNFSDPWPKIRHFKRRLTHPNFLKIYQDILIKDSEIHFKTDNMNLFEDSIQYVSNYPMELLYISLDLHNADDEGNVTTEFEEKFSKRGNRIYKLTAKF
ncbi:MAG: tRNA (guanosine(46)-N7)-methyltransferase TrmB [Candidatus Izemoplasma sp.]